MWYYPALRIFFATLGATVAALLVWLAIRIINRRERWAKWMGAGLIAAIVAYPVSFGPAYWIFRRWKNPYFSTAVDIIYHPILWVRIRSTNSTVVSIIDRYMNYGDPDEY